MAMTPGEISQYCPPENLLQDRVILVTGAGNGIGKAVSIDAAAKGATVVLVDKTVPALEAVYDEIVNSDGAQPAIYPMDLSGATSDDYQAMATTIEQQLGKLNGLVLNAAKVPNLMPFSQITPALYQELMTVNLHAPYLMVQACLSLLRSSSDPTVVFSTHRSNKAYWGTFGIAKAGLVGLLDILAHEFDVDHQPLRVNGIDAGVVNSNLRNMIYPGDDRQAIPQPSDVTNSYLYFLGPDSQGVTGLNLELDSVK